LRAVFDLTTQPIGQPVKIADIARRQSIPQKFLELILASLKQGGFVESRRGADGGYLLTRSADSLTIGEVLRFVEGRSDDRKKAPVSPFSNLWSQVNAAVSDILDSTTFAQLARDWEERQARFVPNWEI
jgi:Rrf2 family cysteine metabolism transcriptional repressor